MSVLGWGARLKLARGEKSQDLWSNLLGISRASWVKYENEETSPNLVLLGRIAQLSSRSIHWIATGEDPPQSTNYDVLVGCIQAVQEQVPTIDAESKAKLTLVLYKDRMANLKKEEIGNAVNRRTVS
jgi:transcriptional regulator with XRE-family HTH domain